MSEEAEANALGLTTQMPTREIFLGSGPTRKLRLGNRIVDLKHGSRRYRRPLLPRKRPLKRP